MTIFTQEDVGQLLTIFNTPNKDTYNSLYVTLEATKVA